MKTNAGKNDRTIRVLIGVIIIMAGIYFRSWWGLLALIPLLTGAIGFCPLYKFFGLNTNSHKSVL